MNDKVGRGAEGWGQTGVRPPPSQNFAHSPLCQVYDSAQTQILDSDFRLSDFSLEILKE